MIKAVFFDIDGTLVSFKTHRVSDDTTEALRELKRRGVKIFVATGRSGLLMKSIGTLDAGFFDGILTFNGQYVTVGGKPIHSHRIPVEDIQSAVDYVRECNASCMFEGSDFLMLNCLNDNARKSQNMLAMNLPQPTDPQQAIGREVIQLILFEGTGKEKELLSVMPSCISTRWHPLLCDIIPRGGGKHVGMQKTLDYFGISREESMAFGDGENDITMIEHAGIGVAMGNADELVKSHADYVTDQVDDNGIGNALRHFGVI